MVSLQFEPANSATGWPLAGANDEERSTCARLEISGRLPPQWFANVAIHLARAHAGIRSGHFACHGGCFEGELVLNVDWADSGLGDLKPVELFCRRAELGLGRRWSVLERFYATLQPRGVYLYVNGVEDSTGFLAMLLVGLERLGLVPVEADLETHAGHIYDELLLEPAGGSTFLDPASVAALPALLEGFLIRGVMGEDDS